jgi:hypothetical protein
MNERIKQLKHQASLWCDINVPEQFSEYGYGEVWEDKFAELIVKECADIARHTDMNGIQIAYIIKEHFGVE